MLGEGLDADVPGLIATTSYSRSAATSLEGWKTLAEVRRQEVNTLVSQIDRQKMQLRGLGADVQYRNKPGWYVGGCVPGGCVPGGCVPGGCVPVKVVWRRGPLCRVVGDFTVPPASCLCVCVVVGTHLAGM